MVFSLTPAAATAMMEARSEVGAPDDWGIRFYARPDGTPGISIDFVAGPEPHDSLGGSGALRTYVDTAVHQEFGDAAVDYLDADGGAELVIRPYRASAQR
jgi:Fe-S cluster assembly iron-binding protein IscA